MYGTTKWVTRVDGVSNPPLAVGKLGQADDPSRAAQATLHLFWCCVSRRSVQIPNLKRSTRFHSTPYSRSQNREIRAQKFFDEPKEPFRFEPE